MSAKTPQISDAEWEVMRVVWERRSVTAEEIVQALAGRKAWTDRTVRTFIGRLTRKGALAARRDGRRYIYRAGVQREECVRRESKSFLSRVFDDAVTPAVVHFVEASNLSQEQIRQLQAILDEHARASAARGKNHER